MSDEVKTNPGAEEQISGETENATESTPTDAAEQAVSPEEFAALRQSLEEKEKRIEELKDKHLRLLADFDNYKKRAARERLDSELQAGVRLIKDLLPVLDDFDRALENMNKTEDVQALREGVQLIHHKLNKTLTDKGLKPMEAMGEVFDPEFHEAITEAPAPDKDLAGKILDVVEKGYYFNEKIVRYAKVVVGK